MRNKSYFPNLTTRQWLALSLLIIAIIFRFVPHVPNFVPITALALFAGTYFGGYLAYLLPILAMIISDFFLGFHSTMIFVYSSLLLAVLIGQFISAKKNPVTIISGTLASSVLFFVITNFGVWITTNWYNPNLAGLINCYYMAIPFFRNSLAGDLFYVTIFFGAYETFSILIKKYETREVGWLRKS